MTRARKRAVRKRLHLIARERGIKGSEIRKAVSSETAMHDLMHRHLLSYDWVLLGDLRGWQRQVRWQRAGRVF
jgi:hypothetical protein